ncbi:serine-rich adhesin for platelets isoform X11 [Cherax quadricarinatus]|uniref:serine-rich adhesin for platelets isoform X11 n=1 Tax=Cherax quadricarinatus TaxID=27406 RepID=UPI00387E2B31
MLGCCNSYGRSHLGGMEGTETLKIQAHTDCMTNKVNFSPVKIETPLESLDNKELENITSREMRTNKHADNKISNIDAISDNLDDGCEKNDSTKDEDSKTEEECRGKPTAFSKELSSKSAESGEVDDVSCSEENSMDNNTFNIINTENSESQELSEMTNDEFPKETCDDGNIKENAESDRGTQTDENSDDDLSCLEEEEDEEEVGLTDESEESADEDLTSESDDGDESDDEAEFDNDSLEDEKNKKEEMTECDAPTTFPLPTGPPLSSVANAEACQKPTSPKIRQRLKSFGKKDNSEFKIEIFEPKRKPQDIPSIKVPDEAKRKDETATNNTIESKSKSESGPVAAVSLRPHTPDKCIDQLAPPNVASPCSDVITPGSADNLLSASLDVSQAIREETDESNRCSPVKSPSQENMNIGQPTADTDCKIRISDEPGKALVTSTPPTNTSSIILERGHHNLTSGEAKDGVEKQNVNVAVETKKPSPMAFTVELGGESGGGDVVINKKLDITASISKWAPKHRRNLSLTKVDEHKVVENFFDENGNSRAKRRSTISRLDKVEEHSGKPPVGRPRSGTIGATGLQQGRRGGGYHSEGYFSSDQDDECPRKTELKSPRSPRTPELRSPQTPQRLIRSSSQDSAKGASLRMRTPSPDNVSRTSHTMTLNESASYLIEKLMMNTPETQRKQPCKTEGRACCKADKKPTTAEVTARIKSDKGSKIDTKMTAESRKESNSATSLGSSHTYQVKQDKEHEGGKEEKDDVSEAGTYTIEKDSSSPEVEQARNNIDRVFGVSGTESEVDVITPQGNAPTHDLWTPTPEPDKFKARVDMNKGIPPGLRGSSFESHDSGGDSDLDTSTSYPINDDDDRLVKRLGSQLKTKLKLGGIDGSPKSPPITTSPRKPDPLALETRLKLTNHFKRERSIVSDSGYDVYTAGKEENSLQSDSSSETSEPVKDSRKSIDNNPPLKFNRAFSLRRARLTCDETAQQLKSPLPVDKKKIARPSSAGNITGNRKIPVSQSKSHQVGQTPRGGSHSQATTPKSGSSDFSRGDGGRFSLRLPHSGSSTTVTKSPSRTCVKKELSSGTARRGAPRSNSTLSAKEVDFQNWKRRKNYDPMKAAAEGRKKAGDKKNDRESQGSTLTTLDRSPSPPGSLLRSASFHGTEGMGVCGRWPRRPNHLYTSEDDGPYSLEEEQSHPVPHCSPLQRSPTSPHHLSSPHTTSPAHHTALTSTRGRRASYALSDEGEGHMGSPTRKASLDESGSEGKRSPLGSTRGIVSGRSKAKMEALDNLVISTIHSLSVKVRTTSETLLQKLKSQYDEEGDRAALLEEVLAHLSESDQTLATGQSRSTSRELAGILRNLKKIEHALEVIDRVMVYVEEGDLEDDDLDATTRHEWGESDY